MTRTIGYLATCLAAALAVASAQAADPSPFAGIPGLKFQYYDVEGRTPAEIYRSMRARGPKGSSDMGGIGLTAWEIKVGWREARRGNQCEVSDPISRLSITIHLPRLVNQSRVSADGLAFWRAAIRGLEIHEAGHARIAWNHRNDFNRAAQKAGCKTIAKAAREAQARIDAIQKAYDRETQHGVTQMPPIEP